MESDAIAAESVLNTLLPRLARTNPFDFRICLSDCENPLSPPIVRIADLGGFDVPTASKREIEAS